MKPLGIFLSLLMYSAHALTHEERPPPSKNSPSVTLGGEVSLPMRDFSDGFCYGHAKVYGTYKELLLHPSIQSLLNRKYPAEEATDEEIKSALKEIRSELRQKKLSPEEKAVYSDLLNFFDFNPAKLGKDYVILLNSSPDLQDIVKSTHKDQQKDWLVLTKHSESDTKKEIPSVVTALEASTKATGDKFPALAYSLEGVQGGHAVSVESVQRTISGYKIIVKDSLFPDTLTLPKDRSNNRNLEQPRLEIVLDKNGKVLSFKTKLDKDDEGRDVISKEDLDKLRLETYSISKDKPKQ